MSVTGADITMSVIWLADGALLASATMVFIKGQTVGENPPESHKKPGLFGSE